MQKRVINKLPSMFFFGAVTFYLITLGSFLLEIIHYPQVVNNLTGLSPFWFFWIFVLLTILHLVFSQEKPKLTGLKEQLVNKVFLLNRWVVLPLSLIFLIVFSYIEHAQHLNYVFANFGVYHYYLLIVFLAAYTAELLRLGQRRILDNHRLHIFLLSVVMSIAFVFFYTWPHDFYVEFSREDGIIENIQFLCFLGASVLFFLSGLRLKKSKAVLKGKKILTILFFIAALGSFFVAMEEISWGQRIFNLSIEQIEEASTKGELNLHNQQAIEPYVHAAFFWVGVYGLLAYWVAKPFSNRWPWLKYITPPPEFSLYFLSVILVYGLYIDSDFPPQRIYLEESVETMLSVAFFFFAGQSFLRLKKRI